jgi:hypothetical protein
VRPWATALATNQNIRTLAEATSSIAPEERSLTQARGGVLEVVQPGASGDEPVDRPASETEQTQLLTGRRIHRQPIGVIGIPLRSAHFLGVSVAPDRAFA